MNERLASRNIRAWVLLLIVLLATGCSSISVSPSSSPDLLEAWRASVVRHCRISPRTEQTLRQLDLTSTYDSDPDEAMAQLHAIALKEPLPDFLFALAEVNYLQGRKREAMQPQQAVGHYYLCAGYAYHYLFATADRKPDQDAIPTGPCPMLAPQNAFDPRFRLACDLYNQGLSKCIAAAQRIGRLDPRHQLHLPTPDGRTFTLSVVHQGFRWQPEEFGPLLISDDFRVKGLDNHHETYGLGVPLIAKRAELPPSPQGTRYPPNACFPVTAFFRFEGGLADLYACRNGQLELYNPLTFQGIPVRGRMVPLQTDLTTPLAYMLSGTELTYVGYGGFLRPAALEGITGVYMLEPYQPGKIPVVMVHGLLSSPLTWAPLFNDLQADPKIREKYQFWFYLYPTANPYLLSAADLRKDLEELRGRVDPQKNDRSFDDLVLVGHSMGGLISRLLTVNSSDAFWKQVSDRPFDQVQIEPETKRELQRTLFFERESCVRRVIFLATPHHGSGLSPSTVGRLAGDLIRLPSNLMKVASDLARNKDLRAQGLLTSVSELNPDSPVLRVLASRPRPENVRYHSIVGVIKPCQAPLESWLSGTSHEEGDGVVPYTSAHLDGAESEVVLPADHTHIHQHPLAILEVRRILLEHLQSLNPIQLVGHEEGK
jgi:pimeloyl-ACP methyl ester carboxylesterase